MRGFQIKEYISEAGSCPFREWLETLATPVKARIQARIGAGVYEARLDFGPGYRIYFGIATGRLVILLFGGDKKRPESGYQQSKRVLDEVERRKSL
jgi:putative addiction module killer protein